MKNIPQPQQQTQQARQQHNQIDWAKVGLGSCMVMVAGMLLTVFTVGIIRGWQYLDPFTWAAFTTIIAGGVILVVGFWLFTVLYLWRKNKKAEWVRVQDAKNIEHANWHIQQGYLPPDREGMPKLIADITQQSVAMDALKDWLGQIGQQHGQAQPLPSSVDAESDRGVLKRNILTLHQADPQASMQQIGASPDVNLSKQRVSELVKEMINEGMMRQW
jgi:hypothetical protein